MSRILVIEDNPDVRDNVADILKLADYEAISVTNGKEGISAAIAHLPDLILCDVMMPQLDGYGVLKILAKRDDTCAIPFVFLTAKSEREDLRRGMNLGADDFVTKPFYKDELLRIIEVRLHKASRTRAVSVPTKWNGFLSDKLMREAMDGLLEGCATRAYKRGEAVYREDERVRDVFVLRRGFAKHQMSTNFGKTLIVYVFKPGELFGYPEMLARSNYAHDTIALTDIEVDYLPATVVGERLRANPNIAHLFLGALSSGLLDADSRMVDQSYLSVRKRCAMTLLRAQKVFDQQPWPMSREELSQWAGTAKETFIRNLTDFKDSSYVRIESDRVTVLDNKCLEDIPG